MIKTITFNPGRVRTSPRATLVEWLVAEGDRILTGNPVCTYEIDKAVATCRSDSEGYLRRILIEPGQRVAPGDLLALVSDDRDEAISRDYPVHRPSPPDRDDKEFDWSEIDERGGPPEPFDINRRAIAERMAMSKRFIPCFYLTVTVDMTSCLALRATLKKAGRKATFNDMCIKAAALALTIHPKVAGIFTPEGFVPRHHLNIGFAAALPDDGLVVPVVKDAGVKPLPDIARETRELALKAKSGELTPEDCSGGIFSVSYLGSHEVDEFIAIVNPGEAAILAASKVIDKPVVRDGQVVVRPVMKVTLSFDHRSIDGALGARFASELKRIMENAEETLYPVE